MGLMDLTLGDGLYEWGLRLAGGPGALLRLPGNSPVSVEVGGRDWTGGLGAGAEQFQASRNAWTLRPGHWQAAPRPSFASGLRTTCESHPSTLNWQALAGDTRFLAVLFTVGAGGFTAGQACVWLRRAGAPGPLRAALLHGLGGAPGAPTGGEAVLLAADQPDLPGEWHAFDLSGAGVLAAGDYLFLLYADPDDSAANHWEVGAAPDPAAATLASADGSVWDNAPLALHMRLTEPEAERRFHLFTLAGALYAVDERADAAPARLYLNGARGVATGAGAASLTDTRQGWQTDEWAGAWLWLHAGKGKGQRRRIAANDATGLTLEENWAVAPDTTSQYLIYATDRWQDITPGGATGIDGVVTGAAVANDQAYFAQGPDVPVLRMRWNPAASPPAHEFMDDGSINADLFYTYHHPTDGVQLWRARNDNMLISRASPAAWGVTTTYGAAIPVGDASQPITRLLDKDGALWVFKADSVWTVADDQPARLNLGLDRLADPRNGAAAAVQGGRMIFSWAGGLAQLELDRLVDAGPPLSGGEAAELLPLGADGLLAAWDGGPDGRSALLLRQGAAWHPLWEAPAGARLRGLTAQPCPGARARLWLDCGGDLLALELPEGENDLDAPRAFEAVLETPMTLDAPDALKTLGRAGLACQGLGAGAAVHLDARLDDEPAWRPAGTFSRVPHDEFALSGLPPARALRLRWRLENPAGDGRAAVLGWGLTALVCPPAPARWRLRLRLEAAPVQAEPSGPPEEFIAWLERCAAEVRPLTVRSLFPELAERRVLAGPPRVVRHAATAPDGWSGEVDVELVEV